jgi:hypothetical protein
LGAIDAPTDTVSIGNLWRRIKQRADSTEQRSLLFSLAAASGNNRNAAHTDESGDMERRLLK